MKLADVQQYLNARGLQDAADGRYAGVRVERGVGTDQAVLTRGKGRLMVLTKSGGPGLILEMHFDRVLVTVRCVGLQTSYDDAEDFADTVDKLMLSPSNVQVGSVPALYVTRAGGEPVHLMTDAARRAHFSCSYVIPVASGL